jgi:tetratricopeptide (TPR) repeat protein/tRNA A-37 threonylcarbamoyl transferase component Bud32
MSGASQRQAYDVSDACGELETRLRSDPSVRVESYLAERPEWANDAETALDLVYTEYVTRCELQQQSLTQEFYRRFPQYAVELERQLAFDALTGDVQPLDSYSQCLDSTQRGDGDRTPIEPPTAELVGARYELLEEIGRGGAAVVYRARQVDLDRIVAIKVLTASLENDRALRLRFFFEGTLIARLQHANIVQVIEVGQWDGRAYLALEYCDGGTLADRITHSTPSIRESAALVRTLALAMHEAHRAGIVHRDLKPANILFTAEGVVKIADFGVAKLMEESPSHTRTGAILGTLCYIAPEQTADSSHNITPAADVYALGAILYELLTGKPPLVAATAVATLQRVQTEDPVSPRRLVKGVPRDLETICLKCLQKQPHERYATAGQLADDLQRFLEHRPVIARPVGVLSRLTRHVRRRPVVWGLAATLLLSLVAGGSIAAWNAHQIRIQRLATDIAFASAFQRCNDLFLLARSGVETTAGKLPLSDNLRAQIADEFSTFLDRYADETPVRHDVVYGYYSLALYHRRDGDQVRFKQFADKCDAGARRLLRDVEQYPQLRQHVPTAYYCLAMLDSHRGQKAHAIEGYRRAAAMARQLLNSGQAVLTKDVHSVLAKSHYRAAALLKKAEPTAAMKEYASACREYRAMLRQWPDDAMLDRNLADSHYWFATFLARTSSSSAAQENELACRAYRMLVRRSPHDADLQLRFAKCLQQQGKYLEQAQQFDDAVRACEEAVGICCSPELRAQPEMRGECAHLLGQMAWVLYRSGQYEAADRAIEQAVQRLEQSLAKDPERVEDRHVLAKLHFQRGSCCHRRGLLDQAIAAYRAAAENFDQVLAINPQAETPRWVKSSRKRVGNIQRELALLQNSTDGESAVN